MKSETTKTGKVRRTGLLKIARAIKADHPTWSTGLCLRQAKVQWTEQYLARQRNHVAP